MIYYWVSTFQRNKGLGSIFAAQPIKNYELTFQLSCQNEVIWEIKKK